MKETGNYFWKLTTIENFKLTKSNQTIQQVHPNKDLLMGQCPSHPGRQQVRHGAWKGCQHWEREEIGWSTGFALILSSEVAIETARYTCTQRRFIS